MSPAESSANGDNPPPSDAVYEARKALTASVESYGEACRMTERFRDLPDYQAEEAAALLRVRSMVTALVMIVEGGL